MIADPWCYDLAKRAAGSTKERHQAYAEMLTTIKSQAELFRFLKYRLSLTVKTVNEDGSVSVRRAGWSRGLRRAINEWLANAVVSNIEVDPDLSAHGWTLCRVCQMTHPKKSLLEALNLTYM